MNAGKRLILFLIPVLIVSCFLFIDFNKNINISIEYKKYATPANSAFTDDNFYKCVVDAYNDENYDNLSYDVSLTDEQLSSIKKISCGSSCNSSTGSCLDVAAEDNIFNVDGLYKLFNLEFLNIRNSPIMNVDLSNNKILKEVNFYGNKLLSSIDLSNNIELTKLNLTGNGLSEIDLSNNINLLYLYLDFNSISDIDLSENVNLNTLGLSNNLLINIDLSENSDLYFLDLSKNQLTSIDLSENANLTNLDLHDNQLSNIDLSNNTLLTKLFVEENKLSVLDLSYNSELVDLYVAGNQMVDIIFSDNIQLETLDLGYWCHTVVGNKYNCKLGNKFTSFNLDSLEELETLYFSNNELLEIDLSKNINLKTLNLSNNQLQEIDLSKNINLTSLSLDHNQITEIDLSKNINLMSLSIVNNRLTELNLKNNLELTHLCLSFMNFGNQFRNVDVIYGSKSLKDYVFPSVVDLANQLSNRVSLKKDDEEVEIRDIIVEDNSKLSLIAEYKFDDCYDLTSCFYDIEYIFYSLKATSDKYIINEDDNYIYTGIDVDNELINSNISVGLYESEINNLSKLVQTNKFVINHDEEIIKEFNIVNISSDTYDLSKDYIYSSSNVTGIFPNITVNNGNLGYDNVNKKIQIKSGDDVLQEFDYVTYSSAKYDLSGDYVKVSDTDISSFISNFDCTNCSVKVYDGSNYLESGEFGDNYKLVFMYGEDVVNSYDLKYAVTGVSLNSERVRLNLDSKNIFELIAYIRPTNAENRNVIWRSSNPDVVTVDSNGVVTAQNYGNAVITVTTEDGGYVDICNVEVSDIVLYNVTYKDGNNIYASQYEEGESIIFKTDLDKVGYELVGWTYIDNDYKLTDNFIMPSNDIELVAKWELIIPEVKNYETSESYITGIPLNTEVSNINLGIDSIYDVKIYNHDNESKTSGLIGTGDKVKIYLSDTFVSEYEVMVKGDLTGDGQGKINDVAKLYQYLKGKITMDECYIEAGNVVNSDDVIKINDVAKLYQFIKEKIDSL